MNNNLSRSLITAYNKLSGRHILEDIAYLEKNQWQTLDEIISSQNRKLFEIIDYAYRFVPYYRRTFDSMGFIPTDIKADINIISQLPILTKAIIRQNWHDLVSTEQGRTRGMTKLNTSGSTGEPLVFLHDRDFKDYVTAETQHHLGWARWRVGDNHAWIYIAPTHPTIKESIRSGLADFAWNRFFLNACALTDTAMDYFAQQLIHRKTKWLWCCTSSLYHFARFIRSSPYQGLTFAGIFTTSEVLLPVVRNFIEETFQCCVYNRYGSMELGGIACECPAQTGYHVCTDNNYIEILKDGYPVENTEAGEIIITNLNNRIMPFIRYNIGDIGAWSSKEKCSCGRSAPRLATIDGRITEMFQTRDGRFVRAGFSGGFSCLADPSIRQFQVIQKTVDAMTVRLATTGEVPNSILKTISKTIQETFGDNVVVSFEFVDKISPMPSGKHQYAVSDINH